MVQSMAAEDCSMGRRSMARRTIARRTIPMTRIFLTAMLAGTAVAQVSAPMLGYLPDQGTLRTMNGIPAAASVGPLLSAGQTFAQIAVSSNGSFALASTDTGEVVVLTVAADGVTLQTATVQGAAAGSLQLSPNGSSALISHGGALQVIGGQAARPASAIGAMPALPKRMKSSSPVMGHTGANEQAGRGRQSRPRS